MHRGFKGYSRVKGFDGSNMPCRIVAVMAGESCMANYERQTPETSLMCRVVARQWPRIVADYNAHGVKIPSYVVLVRRPEG